MFFTLVSYSQILSTDFEAGLPPGWQITNNGLGVNSPWTISAAGGNTGASCLRVSPLTATPAAPILRFLFTVKQLVDLIRILGWLLWFQIQILI